MSEIPTPPNGVEWAFSGEVRPPALSPERERAEPRVSEADSVAATLAAELLTDSSLLADPAVAARAAALSELDFARIKRKLREARVRARDVDTFESKVSKLRRDSEKLAASVAASQRRAEREPSWRDALTTDSNGKTAATFANLCLLLENIYGNRVSYDIMAERPCVDGAPVDDRAVSKIRRHLGGLEGANFGKEDVAEALSLVGSERHSVHPVREYLAECRAAWDGKKRLDAAATTILKVPATDRLALTMLKRTIIAMVARGLNPGEKVDTILILLGFQGQKKSTLFRVLGGPYFGDSKVDITDRKGQMVMASKWIYEWPEIDRVFQKHSDSDIKAFVSQQYDDFIPMYGRSVKTVKRSWLAVGTTNKKRFLTDTTGDRRVWLIDIHRNGHRWKVNERLVESLRDQLFGEAVAEYEAYVEADRKGMPRDENPHRWWFNDAEEAEREQRTAEYHVENAWSETVGRWLAGELIRCPACKGSGDGVGYSGGEPNACSACRGTRSVKRAVELPKDRFGRAYVTPVLVMEHALGVPTERHRGLGPSVADTLAELGWRQGDRFVANKAKVTPYYCPDVNTEADAAEADEVLEREERAALQGDVAPP